MKVQGNRYINNPEMIKNKVEKQKTVPQNMISEDDVTIGDSAKKLVMTARDKVSEFQAMHFSSINGEIKEIPAEYKCENLFQLELKASSISGARSVFEGHSENQAAFFEKWIDDNAAEYLSEDERNTLKEQIGTMVAAVDDLNAREGMPFLRAVLDRAHAPVFALGGITDENERLIREAGAAGACRMADYARRRGVRQAAPCKYERSRG